MSLFGWLRPTRPPFVDHAEIRESARLARVEADARLLLDSYFTHGWLSRRKVRTMGARRWGQAYKLLRASGLVDSINGHIRTRSHTRAVAVLHSEAEAMRARLAGGRYTLPF